MRAFEVLSVVLPDAGGRWTAPVGAHVTPGTYNPYGEKRVQLAWQRFSTSQRPAARPSGRPAARSGPAWPVRPVACR
ncbi:hypothetical protein GCM10010233_17850 [Streptomyces pseudogriseolus]|uniref:Uncharacterized protein n=1 Tax=Streptomyces pseudogriseolus TaxID=36817 RepID=A0ABQ2SYB3_STREZ|nr:hypothetical protein GCM10010233_17850 [Streptomyces gancidicus]GGS42225.1 hypothetical protein GCM10010285_22220 [Streptomyces rubiginosus]